MIKLYKLIDKELHYWECWDSEKKSAIIHWGSVGHKGETKEIKIGLFSNFKKSVQKEFNGKLTEGFGEFEEDKFSFLEIEFKIEGFGTEQDLSKRHELEQKMDEILG